MSGPIMWIILGVLVAIVAGFLVVSTVLDKRKNKRAKIENEKIQKEIKFAGFNIAKEVLKIVNANEKHLEKFVVSIGKQKMSDINLKAKNNLKELKKSRNMSLIKQHDEIDLSEKFLSHFENIFKEKSNNWKKRNQKDIVFFKNYKKPSEQKEKKEANPKRKKLFAKKEKNKNELAK